MTVRTPRRIATLLGTVVLLIGVLATTAAAEPGNPATEAAIAASRASAATPDRRSPDTQDVATQSRELDPAITAAIAAHGSTGANKRSPDTNAATNINGGSPTTPSVPVVASDSVFHWTDAAIGAVAGVAIALLLGGMILLFSTRGRHGSLAL